MKPSSRPPGVTLIAIFLIFIGLLSFLLAPLGRLLELDLATGLTPALLGAVLAGNGLLCLLVAWGLWRLRSWAWLLAIACALLAMASPALWLAQWLRLGGPPTAPATVLGRLADFALWAWILGYLCLPSVRQAFRRSPGLGA